MWYFVSKTSGEKFQTTAESAAMLLACAYDVMSVFDYELRLI